MSIEEENHRFKEALQKIIDESICKGIDSSFGSNCYAVIAQEALYPPVSKTQ